MFLTPVKAETQQIDTSYRGILKVALPISLSTFVQFIVVFTDNYFLSQVGETALNAAGNSGILYVAFMMIAVGLSSGLQILVARRVGESSEKEAGQLLLNALLLALFIGIMIFGLVHFVRYAFLDLLLSDESLSREMSTFLSIRTSGYLIYPLVLCFIGFYSGIARTRILFYITLLMAVINLGGDYLFIFGNSWIAPMGSKGAAWASFLSEACAVLFVVAFTAKHLGLKRFHLKEAAKIIPVRYSRKILKVSIPLMGQQFLALATWTSFFFMVEKMGQEELYISHLVRAFYFLSFVIVFGIGQTTKTYVSTLIAEERQADLKLVMRKLITTNIVGISILVHGFIFYPQFLFSLFTDDPFIIESGARVLYIVFIAAIIFSFSSVFLNAIEGAGKTSVAFWIELSCIISYIVFSYLMIFKWEQDIVRVWMMDWLYFGLMGILSLLFLIRKPWMYTRI